jgi:hypothetical protein
MSAALQLAAIPSRPNYYSGWNNPNKPKPPAVEKPPQKAEQRLDTPSASLAFYRKHSEKLLRRYLYASMLVGRAPNILAQPLDRGSASYQRLETFEDSIIFVLDMEKCLDKLQLLDRQLIARIVLQEYSHSEAAMLLGIGTRYACIRYGLAMDRLTGILMDTGILHIPHTS